MAMGLVMGASAQAEDIVIAVASEVTAMDPHYHNTGNNNQIVWHLTLVTEGRVDTTDVYDFEVSPS